MAPEIGTFSDELLAYLDFEYIKSRSFIDKSSVYLAVEETAKGPIYQVFALVDIDLLSVLPYLNDLKTHRYASEFELHSWTPEQCDQMRDQTNFFIATYHQPIERTLESLNPCVSHTALTHFVLSKSKTDQRVRTQTDPRPEILSRPQAQQLVADPIGIAQCYAVPLDFFVGIGAMGNNYMHVPGDLEKFVVEKTRRDG